MRAALAVEALKLRRSPAARVAAAVLALVLPLAATGFVWAARSGGDSTMALKVRPMLIGTGWAAYLGLLGELVSVGALAATGFVVSWVVGREFTDRTVGGLLAQPVRPGRVLLAKVTVAAGWCLGWGAVGLLVTVPGGVALGLGAPDGVAVRAAAKVAALLVLGVVLTLPLAWVSTRLRGYLSGISALIGLIVLTQVVTLAGAGGWFPYAAPSLWSGMGGAAAAAAVTPVQLLLAIPVGVAGLVAAARRWERAELV